VFTNVLCAAWNIPELARINAGYYPPISAAAALQKERLNPGDKIALISSEAEAMIGRDTFVANLNKLQIISQVTDPDAFLQSSKDAQARTLDMLRSTGAKAALLFPVVVTPDASWNALGGGYFYKPLPPP